jgi:hypothetical protein
MRDPVPLKESVLGLFSLVILSRLGGSVNNPGSFLSFLDLSLEISGLFKRKPVRTPISFLGRRRQGTVSYELWGFWDEILVRR